MSYLYASQLPNVKILGFFDNPLHFLVFYSTIVHHSFLKTRRIRFFPDIAMQTINPNPPNMVASPDSGLLRSLSF